MLPRISPVAPIAVLTFFGAIILLIGTTKGISLQWDIGNFAVGIGTTAVAIVSWMSISAQHRKQKEEEALKEILAKKSIVTDFLTALYALQLPASYQTFTGIPSEKVKLDINNVINVNQYHAAMLMIFDIEKPVENKILSDAARLAQIGDRFPTQDIISFASFCRKYFCEEETRIKSTI